MPTQFLIRVENRLLTLIDRIKNLPSFVLLTIFFFISLITTLSISYFVFDGLPHIEDSICQVFQAKIFRLGKFFALSHPLKEFFDYEHMINDGKWYCKYPPNHSLLILLGLIFNLEWMVNPIVGSLTLFVIYFIGKEVGDKNIGLLSALLLIISPFFIIMSSELMNHTSALFFNSIFLLFILKCVKSKRTVFALLSGASLGFSFGIRPYDAVLISIVFILNFFYHFIKQPKNYIFPILIFCLFLAIFSSWTFIYNYITNDDPFLFGYSKLHGKEQSPGFGLKGFKDKSGHLTRFTPYEGFLISVDYLTSLNKTLFEFPLPSLIFLIAFLLTKQTTTKDWLLFGGFISLVFGYFLYWFHDGKFMGPRFLYTGIGLIIPIIAKGITHFDKFLNEITGKTFDNQRCRGFILIMLCLAALISFSAPVPNLMMKYKGFFGVSEDLIKAIERNKVTKAIIFCEQRWAPGRSEYRPEDYSNGFLYNDPELKGNLIFARDLKEKNYMLKRYYPDYAVYKWVYNEKGKRFELKGAIER